jgi:hypothetical protein
MASLCVLHKRHAVNTNFGYRNVAYLPSYRIGSSFLEVMKKQAPVKRLRRNITRMETVSTAPRSIKIISLAIVNLSANVTWQTTSVMTQISRRRTMNQISRITQPLVSPLKKRSQIAQFHMITKTMPYKPA